MANSLDLTNLRDITGGDPELEAMLLQTFVTSSRDSLSALRAAFSPGQDENWRKAAHALKGTALNIGAAPLAELCKNAESVTPSAPDEKQGLLTAIEAELATVCAAIKA